MSVLAVRRIPDGALARPARPVGAVDGAARAVARDLLDTMRAMPACVGLAAPQVGADLRMFVVDVTGHHKARTCHGEIVLFDPVLLVADHPELAREGCLSVPDLTGDVARATRVVVAGIGIDGERREIPTDAFEARAVLHELDHLDGVVFLDRVEGPHGVHARRVYR